jgi:hypothetical protein
VWAVRSSDIDWRRIRPQQLVNHFEAPCPLTTKLGLAFCLRGTGGAAVAESLRPQLLLDGVATRATHWHFFPRYADDQNFKNPPWLQMHHFDLAKITPEKRDELIEKLKSAFLEM